jgi:hypothetical protein
MPLQPRAENILCVEMEASALYTFGKIAGVPILCLAYVTNTMGLGGDDFEKGEADGTTDALAVLERVTVGLGRRRPSYAACLAFGPSRHFAVLRNLAAIGA